MSAIDVPPHLGLVGRAAGEFGARPGARTLAVRVFAFCTAAGLAAMALAARQALGPNDGAKLVVPMALWIVALVGLGVRSAQVRVDRDGVRWGWAAVGVRMGRARIKGIVVYSDAIALEPRRGSTWFLSARDWERFAELGASLRRAGYQVVDQARPAPWRVRLQTYGVVLDALLVMAALGEAAMVLRNLE